MGIGIGIILTVLISLGFNNKTSMTDLEIEERARTLGMQYENEFKVFFKEDVE